MSTIELKQYTTKDKQLTGSTNSAFEHTEENGNINEKISDIENKQPIKGSTVIEIGQDYINTEVPPLEGFASKIYDVKNFVEVSMHKRKHIIKWIFYTILLVTYFVYFGFAMAYEFGSTESITLLWVTCLIVFCVLLSIMWTHCGENIKQNLDGCLSWLDHHGQTVLWIVLAVIYTAVFTFILVDVFHITNDPYNLVSLGGLLCYILLCFVFSYSPAHVNWRAVLWGIALQFIFALIILRWSWGYKAFEWLGDVVSNFLANSDAGAEFVFGPNFRDHFFAFSVLPVIIFFSSIISVLYYLGWMQVAIQKIGWVLQTLMGTTAGESINAAGNIFIGQTEAPLMIRPILQDMTRSEIHAVMTGGFATIAGSVLAGYIMFGVPANHLISASVMSAPAALAMSKLFYPETEVSKTTAEAVKTMEKVTDRNIIEAAASGASQSIKLVANIAANLIAFIALLEFFNSTLTWLGHRVGWDDPPLTFELICSYVFYPLALIMGTTVNDCRMVAELIGVKTFINEFVAYERLGVLITNKEMFTSHLEQNGTYSYDNDDIILYDYVDSNGVSYNQTVLEDGILEDRSEVISTYALCGFANIGSMGIMLGGLGPMAPHRKSDMASVVVRAMIAGNVACFMTACIAGLFYQGTEV